MNDRLERLAQIRKILHAQRIDSQDALLQILENDGHRVTQATLSRDLKYMKIGKVSDGSSGYFYAIPSDEEKRETEARFSQDFLRGYVSIGWNDTMAVVRTFSGHSDAVALAIDNMGFENVLGTIAGRDNTVFVALRKGYTGDDFVREMKSRIPDIELD